MAMIEKLTPEQEAMLPVYEKKWLEIGLSTEPLDFEKAKEAAKLAYKLAGQKEPNEFYATRSPVEAIELIQKLSKKKTGKEFSKNDIVLGFSYGFHDAYWLAFFEYFKEVLDIKEVAKLDGLIELAKHCGWVSFYDDCVVFQDRPVSVKFDEQRRTHSETGPAILYGDGFGVYIWHGVRIPAEWIEKKSELTAKTALTWPNIEQRRCACEILGWSKILDELEGKVIDEDGDPEIGTLLEVSIPEIGREKFLKVKCGTGRIFALPVPPNMKTALEANAWTYNIDPDMLKNLEVRT